MVLVDERLLSETPVAVDSAEMDLVSRIRWTCGLPVLEGGQPGSAEKEWVLGAGSPVAGRHMAPPATEIECAWTRSLDERKPEGS